MLVTVLRRTAWCLLVSLLLADIARADSAPIVFYSTETPPFWLVSLPDGGSGGRILRLMSEAAGVAYRMEYLPMKRFRDSAAPFMVGTPDLLTSQNRRAVFPIGMFSAALFSYKPRIDVSHFHGIADLRLHTLGVLRGTLENKDYFVKNSVRIEESDSVDSLIRKLKMGRIDFCIMVAATGRHTISQLFPQEQDNFALAALPGSERPLAIMIDTDTPSGKEVAARYRQVLAKVLRSQAYRDILEQDFKALNTTEYQLGRLDKFIQVYESTWGD